jgi:hypothetical protein
VPDGTYEFLGDAIRVLAAPAHSRADLKRLLVLTQKAQEQHADPDEVTATIANEFPDLAPTINVFVQSGGEKARWALALLVAVLTMLLQAAPLVNDQGATSDDVERMTERVVSALRAHPVRDPRTTDRGRGAPAGRPKTAQRKKRPGKTYGQNKRRKRR